MSCTVVVQFILYIFCNYTLVFADNPDRWKDWRREVLPYDLLAQHEDMMGAAQNDSEAVNIQELIELTIDLYLGIDVGGGNEGLLQNDEENQEEEEELLGAVGGVAPNPSESLSSIDAYQSSANTVYGEPGVPTIAIQALSELLYHDVSDVCRMSDEIMEAMRNNPVIAPICSHGLLPLSTLLIGVENSLASVPESAIFIPACSILRPVVLEGHIEGLDTDIEVQQTMLGELQTIQAGHSELDLRALIQRQRQVILKVRAIADGLKAMKDRLSQQPGWGLPEGWPDGQGATFILGYERMGYKQSLQGLQGMLLTTTGHVSHALKTLMLEAQVSKSDRQGRNKVNHLNPRLSSFATKGSQSKKGDVFVNGAIKMQAIGEQLSPLGVCRYFGTMHGHRSNLEYKTHMAQAGIITMPVPTLRLGVSYTYNQATSQQRQGMPMRSSLGSAKAKTETNTLSAVLAWNADASGFSAGLASCCGWGNIKNTRYVSPGRTYVGSKGNPALYLNGGLIQVGYNVPLSSTILLKPYVESMIVQAHWRPYEEVDGILPANISTHKERIIEKSIGLSQRWNSTDSSHVQTWIAGISGQRKTNAVTATPLQFSLARYEMIVPVVKKTYAQGELGIRYEVTLSDHMCMRVNGTTRFTDLQHYTHQNIRCLFQYTY